MKNLRSRIEELERRVRPKEIDYGRIYDALKEMDYRTFGHSEEDFEKRYIERNGTREQFIEKSKEKARTKHY